MAEECKFKSSCKAKIHTNSARKGQKQAEKSRNEIFKGICFQYNSRIANIIHSIFIDLDRDERQEGLILEGMNSKRYKIRDSRITFALFKFSFLALCSLKVVCNVAISFLKLVLSFNNEVSSSLSSSYDCKGTSKSISKQSRIL